MASQPAVGGPSVLVADIGGTNCRFQLWSVSTTVQSDKMLIERIYPTEDYERFDQALQAFLDTPEATAAPPAAGTSVTVAASAVMFLRCKDF